jgi:hypothetical protein
VTKDLRALRPRADKWISVERVIEITCGNKMKKVPTPNPSRNCWQQSRNLLFRRGHSKIPTEPANPVTVTIKNPNSHAEHIIDKTIKFLMYFRQSQIFQYTVPPKFLVEIVVLLI